jgi:hypothetical protein
VVNLVTDSWLPQPVVCRGLVREKKGDGGDCREAAENLATTGLENANDKHDVVEHVR